jgi:hypothetical protein
MELNFEYLSTIIKRSICYSSNYLHLHHPGLRAENGLKHYLSCLNLINTLFEKGAESLGGIFSVVAPITTYEAIKLSKELFNWFQVL